MIFFSLFDYSLEGFSDASLAVILKRNKFVLNPLVKCEFSIKFLMIFNSYDFKASKDLVES